MSEQLFAGEQDDDPGPSRFEYPVNYQTGEQYSGELSYRIAMRALNEAADAVLDAYRTDERVDEADVVVQSGTARLRRRAVSYDGEESHLFFYTERYGEADAYCRSWGKQSEVVAGTDERADQVAERILAAFPLEQEPLPPQRRSFGARIVALLHRSRV